MSILALSGHIPEHIGDIVRFTRYSGDRNISQFCGYASDFISQVINDDDIEGAVYPRSCDSARIITSYLEKSGKRLFQFNIPQGTSSYVKDYYIHNLKAYAEWLGYKDNEAPSMIRHRIGLINARNRSIKELYESLDAISYHEYLRYVHEMLKRPLAEQTIGNIKEVSKAAYKPVFVVGPFLSEISITKIIEDNGMKVVGDNLPESARLAYSMDVNTDGDVFENIANAMLNRRMSPTQNYFRSILDNDLAEIKKKGVRGVIFVLQKYCEPYDYLYSVYSKQLKEAGIPSVKVSCLNSEDSGKAKLVLEAFADMI